MTSPEGRADNLPAVIFMVVAMGLFAAADALIKVVARDISTAQLIFLLGLGGSTAFAAMLVSNKEVFFPAEAFGRVSLVRSLGEVVGAIGFISALATGNLAVVSAVLQAAPLAVTAGAVLVLGEAVGVRRWMAVLVGFAGVLCIIQPGSADFEFATVFALIGMLGLSVRDLATRAAPKALSNRQLGFYGFIVLIPAGLVFMVLTSEWQPLDILGWGVMIGIVAFAVVAYYAVTIAMRMGEISFVTPFRYSRIIFAMLIGTIFFGETLDSLTLFGITVVIASGLYTMWRENSARR